MASRADSIYALLPTPLQHAAVSAYGYWWHWIRQGGRFREYQQGFLDREHFGVEEWRGWQTEELRRVLRIAAKAPHYQRAWKESGFGAGDIDDFAIADLARLPT